MSAIPPTPAPRLLTEQEVANMLRARRGRPRLLSDSEVEGWHNRLAQIEARRLQSNVIPFPRGRRAVCG